MMRWIVAALALCACAPRQNASGCDVSFDREVAFTAPGASDVVTASLIGPSCDKAIALYAVVSAEGFPVWVWSAPAARAFGDLLQTADAAAARTFLERWSDARLERTSAAPPWPLGQGAHTTLDRLTYEDVRARDLPMLCHFSGTGVETCVFWEPAAAGAGHFLDRDVAEPAERRPT